MIEFFLQNDPKNVLAKWRLTVEASFAGDNPIALCHEARKVLAGASESLDALVGCERPCRVAQPAPENGVARQGL